jgi:hypothetical protein
LGGGAANASNWFSRSEVSTGPARRRERGSSATDELTNSSAEVRSGWEVGDEV